MQQGLVTHANQSFGTMFGIGPPDRLVGTSAAGVVRRIKAAFADPGEFLRRTSEAFTARKPISPLPGIKHSAYAYPWVMPNRPGGCLVSGALLSSGSA